MKPTSKIEFLGVWYDFEKQIISVMPSRLRELSQELQEWSSRQKTTRKQLESLLGKLQFVSNCVRPGRVLVLRLREQLTNMKQVGWSWITDEMRKDIEWWRKFLPVYDNASIMWMDQECVVDTLIATDASLDSIGGWDGNHYFTKDIPHGYRTDSEWNIAHFEMMALVVAIKLWSQKLVGKRFLVSCDNMVVVQVVNKGSARNALLKQWLRELMFVTAVVKCEVVVRYVRLKENVIPDLLSRISQPGC